jgi:hypothetical protein
VHLEEHVVVELHQVFSHGAVAVKVALRLAPQGLELTPGDVPVPVRYLGIIGTSGITGTIAAAGIADITAVPRAAPLCRVVEPVVEMQARREAAALVVRVRVDEYLDWRHKRTWTSVNEC